MASPIEVYINFSNCKVQPGFVQPSEFRWRGYFVEKRNKNHHAVLVSNFGEDLNCTFVFFCTIACVFVFLWFKLLFLMSIFPEEKYWSLDFLDFSGLSEFSSRCDSSTFPGRGTQTRLAMFGQSGSALFRQAPRQLRPRSLSLNLFLTLTGAYALFTTVKQKLH